MKFTVGRKISLLILAAAGGLAVSTAEGWLTLGRVFDAADYANSSALPATQALAAADRALHNERIDLWNHIASHDAEAMAGHEAAINQDRGEGRDALASYAQYARDEQDKALLENDRAAATAFEAVLDAALALSKQGRKAEASALLQANVDVAATTDGALSAHVYYAAELARQQAAEAQAIEGRARRNSLLIALATLAAVVAIGVAIVLTVTRPLRHAVDVLLEIDRGNLQAEVRVRGNDETAAMLGALESMRGNLLERTSREREAAERERAIAAENARIRTSLDKSSTPMLVVDAGGLVGYANESMRELLARRGGGTAAGHQGIDGLPFAALEWIPAPVRDAALAATAPWSTELEVGDAHLRLGATPVADAQGNRLGTAVQWLDRTDEVRAERELHALVQSALDGDLTVRAREEGKSGFYAALARGMNALLGSTAQLVQRVTVAAEQVASGAGEIARGNSDLSQRTERQAASLEQTASSMEEMTSTVRQTADNAAQANQLATTAREQASRGGDVVAAAIAAMGEITGASRRIADIINVIDEIAFQTNLLALNAAVEAARAGEQGRGFAVVAGEVRALAGRSAAAAREIKSLIGDSVGKVEQGSGLVDQSGRTLADIVQYVKKVSDIVAEIAAASAEQASGVEQVNKAVMSMDEATQQNAALVEQVSAAADNLRQQSEALREVLEAYRVDPAAAAPGGPARMAA